ncbi:MAG TPA: non-heme iron oxygenase ferredoxin subunit [Acidimicrobiales bacterium]|nr:non-heme iron oxygenase ferredoxin subunit [Acidimicrobiales bacterium]
MKQRICAFDELEPNTARRFDVDGRHIAVVRLDDDVYAIGDVCSHQNISLSEGEIHTGEKTIECWKHGSEFSLETGESLTLPATKGVPVYEVVVDGDDVLVVVD